MSVFKTLATAATVGVAGYGATVAYLFRKTMMRGGTSTEETMKMAGTDWSVYDLYMDKRQKALDAMEEHDWVITSNDGLKLRAYFYPNGGSKNIVISCHGYTGEAIGGSLGVSEYYFQNGYAMLLPDLRAHGRSDGTYIGFGCLDRHDLMKWIKLCLKKCGHDVNIWLHGTSMGASTVLMTSSLKLPKQVKGVISDCGFSSSKEVFSHCLENMYHLPPKAIMMGADVMCKKLAGYGTDECNATREVKNSKVPILFIHGSNDTFVPTWMCEKMYKACTSPKQILIVEDAAHGEAWYKDREAYSQALDKFLGNPGTVLDVMPMRAKDIEPDPFDTEEEI